MFVIWPVVLYHIAYPEPQRLRKGNPNMAGKKDKKKENKVKKKKKEKTTTEQK